MGIVGIIIGIGLFLYAVLFVFLRLMRNRLAFPAPVASYAMEAEHGFLMLRASDGANVAALWLPHPQAEQVLLYSHGNGEDIGLIFPTLKAFHKMGFSVLAYDYAGYGHSDGRPSESGLYRAADTAWDFLTQTQQYDPAQITVLGYSMGSAAASYLAGTRTPRGLVVVAGFSSAIEAILPFNIFPWESYLNNLAFVKRAQCPIYILHGTRDRVVPFRNGKRLFAGARGQKYFAIVPEAGHYTIADLDPASYWHGIARFIRTGNPYEKK